MEIGQNSLTASSLLARYTASQQAVRSTVSAATQTVKASASMPVDNVDAVTGPRFGRPPGYAYETSKNGQAFKFDMSAVAEPWASQKLMNLGDRRSFLKDADGLGYVEAWSGYGKQLQSKDIQIDFHTMLAKANELPGGFTNEYFLKINPDSQEHKSLMSSLEGFRNTFWSLMDGAKSDTQMIVFRDQQAYLQGSVNEVGMDWAQDMWEYNLSVLGLDPKTPFGQMPQIGPMVHQTEPPDYTVRSEEGREFLLKTLHYRDRLLEAQAKEFLVTQLKDPSSLQFIDYSGLTSAKGSAQAVLTDGSRVNLPPSLVDVSSSEFNTWSTARLNIRFNAVFDAVQATAENNNISADSIYAWKVLGDRQIELRHVAEDGTTGTTLLEGDDAFAGLVADFRQVQTGQKVADARATRQAGGMPYAAFKTTVDALLASAKKPTDPTSYEQELAQGLIPKALEYPTVKQRDIETTFSDLLSSVHERFNFGPLLITDDDILSLDSIRAKVDQEPLTADEMQKTGMTSLTVLLKHAKTMSSDVLPMLVAGLERQATLLKMSIAQQEQGGGQTAQAARMSFNLMMATDKETRPPDVVRVYINQNLSHVNEEHSTIFKDMTDMLKYTKARSPDIIPALIDGLEKQSTFLNARTKQQE